MSFKASSFAKITAVSDADMSRIKPRYLQLLRASHENSATIPLEFVFDYCIFGAISATSEEQKARFTGRELRAIERFRQPASTLAKLLDRTIK